MDENKPLIQASGASADISSEEITNERTRGNAWTYFVLCFIMIMISFADKLSAMTAEQYLYHWCKVHGQYSNLSAATETTRCSENKTFSYKDVQKLVSRWEIYFALINNGCFVLVFVIYGYLSDCSGRKPVLIVTITGNALRYFILAVIIYQNAHIAYFMLTNFIEGTIGCLPLVSFVVHASIADLFSDEKKLAFAFAMLSGLKGVGILASDIFSGYFINNVGLLYPQITSFCVSVLTLFVLLIAIPNRRLMSTTNSHDAGTRTSILGAYKLAWKSFLYLFQSVRRRNQLKPFVMTNIATCLYIISAQAYIKPLRIFVLQPPFCWTATLYGWLNGGMYACSIVGAALMKLLHKWFSNDTICCLGLCSRMCLSIITACAVNTMMIFLGILFASVNASDKLSHVIFVPIILVIFSATENIWKRFIFLLAAVLFGFTLVLALFTRRISIQRQREPDHRTVENLN